MYPPGRSPILASAPKRQAVPVWVRMQCPLFSSSLICQSFSCERLGIIMEGIVLKGLESIFQWSFHCCRRCRIVCSLIKRASKSRGNRLDCVQSIFSLKSNEGSARARKRHLAPSPQDSKRTLGYQNFYERRLSSESKQSDFPGFSMRTILDKRQLQCE